MSSSAPIATEVDDAIWRAVAGSSVRIPGVNSYVYYFLQGHLEQFSNSEAVTNYNSALMRPWIPCQVISVRFLSDPVSDQAFAKILLQPLQLLGSRPSIGEIGGGKGAEDEDVFAFAKILTRSDANNGGGFSVPRFCADMILPPLDFSLDPPYQNLVMRDTSNNVWEFRHIYRGTPRRHLLTTGWSKFVNAKRLVSGDSVVFMRKKSTSELFLGVRRERIFSGAGGDAGEALEAIEKAARGVAFEVVYYPKIGVPDFVVKAEKVKQALQIQWMPGMKVRLAVETDDSSRMTWIQGVINTVAPPAAGLWCGSPWRMMQVTWDEECSETNDKVSPWEVEYLTLSPLLDPDFPLSKRFKLLPDPGMLHYDTERRSYPSSHSSIAITGSHPITSPLLNSSPFPSSAGIQEARLDGEDHGRHPTPANDTLPSDEAEPEVLKGVSTALALGNSYSDTVSTVESRQLEASPSIRLFGKMIFTESGNGEGSSSSKENVACSEE